MEKVDQDQFEEAAPEFEPALVVHRHTASSDRRLLLVFVHGLGGERYGTWGNFPKFVFEDLPQLDVALYSYRTAHKRFFSFESFDLETQSELLANELRESDYDGILLAGHSMGGLLCKGVIERLITLSDSGTLKKILGLFLLATPQLGASRLLGLFSAFNNDAQALKLFGGFIKQLTDCFENKVATLESRGGGPPAAVCHIPLYVVVSASDLWVDRHSAGNGIPNSQRLLVAGSHTQAVKPRSKSDLVYNFVRQRLQQCLRRFEDSQAAGAAASGDDAAYSRDNDLLTYKRRVADLRGSFESRTPGGIERVLKEGPPLADLIGNLKDELLSPLRRVFKYEYGGWLNLLIARCAGEKSGAIAAAHRGAAQLREALAQIAALKEAHSRGQKEELEAYEFIVQEGEDRERSLYLLAIAEAFLGENEGSFSREQVRQTLSEIGESYRRRFPPDQDRWLRWAFASSD